MQGHLIGAVALLALAGLTSAVTYKEFEAKVGAGWKSNKMMVNTLMYHQFKNPGQVDVFFYQKLVRGADQCLQMPDRIDDLVFNNLRRLRPKLREVFGDEEPKIEQGDSAGDVVLRYYTAGLVWDKLEREYKKKLDKFVASRTPEQLDTIKTLAQGGFHGERYSYRDAIKALSQYHGSPNVYEKEACEIDDDLEFDMKDAILLARYDIVQTLGLTRDFAGRVAIVCAAAHTKLYEKMYNIKYFSILE